MVNEEAISEMMDELESINENVGGIVSLFNQDNEPWKYPDRVTEIVGAVAAETHVSAQVLMARCMGTHERSSQNMAIYLCRKLTNKSIPELTRLFGFSAHGKLISAIKAHMGQMSCNVACRTATMRVLAQIESAISHRLSEQKRQGLMMLDSLRDELPYPSPSCLEGVTLFIGEKREYRAELAVEMAIKIVTLNFAKQISVWSSHTDISLQKYFLAGDSLVPGHRWTLTSGFLKCEAENHPAVTEDRLDERVALECGSTLRSPHRINWPAFAPGRDEIVVVDIDGDVDLVDLVRLNALAKERHFAAFVCCEVKNERGNSYEANTFGELALSLCVEKGVDLSRCADRVLFLYPWRKRTGIGAVYSPPASCEVRLLHPINAPIDFRFVSWAHYAKWFRVRSY